MITYKVVTVEVAGIVPHYSVIAKESGVIVFGPTASRNLALAEANLRASTAPGNRVESW